MAIPQRSSATALIVEDNLAQQYILAKHLSDAGYNVAVAGTMEKALTAAQKLPDVILLDVNLPDGSGFDICKHIKEDSHTRNIPVVFLSATHQTASAKDQGLAVGADAFLFAPVEPSSLMAVLDACVHRGKRRYQ
jgi:phosphoserine phosphatase RsbU/P